MGAGAWDLVRVGWQSRRGGPAPRLCPHLSGGQVLLGRAAVQASPAGGVEVQDQVPVLMGRLLWELRRPREAGVGAGGHHASEETRQGAACACPPAWGSPSGAASPGLFPGQGGSGSGQAGGQGGRPPEPFLRNGAHSCTCTHSSDTSMHNLPHACFTGKAGPSLPAASQTQQEGTPVRASS